MAPPPHLHVGGRTLNRLLIVTLMLTPLVAGCLDDAASLDDAAGDTTVITRPDDYAYLDDPALANGSHLHDYWGGEDTLVVMQTTEEVGGTLCGDDPFLGERFQPSKPIPMGTASLNVTVTWTDDADAHHGDVELWVKAANEEDSSLVGAITSGERVHLASDNDRNDIPHQLMSAWAFDVGFRGAPTDATARPVCAALLADRTASYDGEVTVTVVAHRGLDIPLFPGHPDRWAGRTTIDLAHHEASWNADTRTPLGRNCLPCSGHYTTTLDGAIVPPDASHVEVVLETTRTSVHDLGLAFHGSDTREWTVLTPDETTEEQAPDGLVVTKTYRIDAAGIGDGPYAQQSLWEFVTFVDDGDTADQSVFRGDKRLTAVVYRA